MSFYTRKDVLPGVRPPAPGAARSLCPECGTRRSRACSPAPGAPACRDDGGRSLSSSSTSRARPRWRAARSRGGAARSSHATSARSRRSWHATVARSRSSRATRWSPCSACPSCTRTMRSAAVRAAARGALGARGRQRRSRPPTTGLGLDTRTGVNTGEVVGGDNVHREHAGDRATWSTWPRASQQRAAAGGDRDRRSARTGWCGMPPHRRGAPDPLELKGKSELVSAYRVVDLAPDAPGLAATARWSPDRRPLGSSWQCCSRPFDSRRWMSRDEQGRHHPRRGGRRQVPARPSSSRASSASAPRCSRAAVSPTARESRTSRSRCHAEAARRDRTTSDTLRRAARRRTARPPAGHRRVEPGGRAARAGADPGSRLTVLARPEEIAWAVRRLLESTRRIARPPSSPCASSTTCTGPAARRSSGSFKYLARAFSRASPVLARRLARGRS